jgi:hypothetical protein
MAGVSRGLHDTGRADPKTLILAAIALGWSEKWPSS